MKSLILSTALILTGTITMSQLTYPVTKKENVTDVYFGTKVADPYRWLEDDNSEATKNWVTQQNKVTFDYLNTIPYREKWYKQMEALNNYPRYSSPSKGGEFFYFSKNDGLQNQSVLYRQKGLNGTPEMVLDPNKFSAEGTTSLAAFSLSKNGRYAVVGKSAGGSDWRTFFVMDMQTLQYLPDSLAWVKVSGVSWLGDGFFYSRYPSTEIGKELSTKNENHQVFYHKVGTPQSSDQLVYEDAANPLRFHGVYCSEDERYVFLNISDRSKKSGNALWYYDNNDVQKTFKPIIKEAGDYSYSLVDVHNGQFIISTNDGARNQKVVLINPAQPEPANWITLIPEQPENITSISAAGGKLFVTYLKDVTSRVYVYSYDGKKEREVQLPALGSASGFGGKKEDQVVFYTFTSFIKHLET
jgi:prolyl oligopeptidase